MRDRVGHADYDAARSDALYERVYAARENVRRGATVLGLALLLLGCAARPRASTPAPATPSARRLLLATLVDAASTLAAVFLLAAPARVLDLDGDEATAALLGRLAPFVALALHALLLRTRRTPGAALARLPASAPTPWRALVATVALLPCAPLALLASPYVLFASRGVARALAAPHRAIAGA